MTRPWTRTICACLLVAAASAAAPAGAVEIFVSIEPCRIFDTRTVDDAPALLNSQLTSNSFTHVRDITIQGNPNCPDVPASNVKAVAANVIVVRAEDAGFLSAFPQATGYNNTSLINFATWVDNSHFARDNGFILPLDDDPSDGDLSMGWQRQALPDAPEGTHSAHVVIDVTGYLLELQASSGLQVTGNTVGLDTTGCLDGEVLTFTDPGWACESALGGGGAGFDKTDIYINSQGGSSPGSIGEVLTRTASCNDANDIALSGHCHTTGSDVMYLSGQEGTNFDNTGAAASFTCKAEAQGTNGNMQARIVCVNVP